MTDAYERVRLHRTANAASANAWGKPAAQRVPDVNATGVFNTQGLSCPESDCARCAAPLNTSPFNAPANFTGVDVIRCRYRAEMCDALRDEEQRCKRHARSLCGEVDTRVEAKAKCKRVLNRQWKLKCKEERARLVSYTSAAYKRAGDLREKVRGARAKRNSGSNGNDLPMLEMELSRLKSAIKGAYDSAETNSGGVVFPTMSTVMEAFLSGPSSLDTTYDMQNTVEQLVDIAQELKVLDSTAHGLCSHEASLNSNEAKVTCEEIEESTKLSEKRQNRCAARLSDYLASTAKIDGLIVEKDRRFKLLENLESFMSTFNNAWDMAALDDDDTVDEPSTRFNLTEHITTGIVSSMMHHVTIATARRELATAKVDEDAFCAQIIPRLQLTLLGHGVARGDLACPPPHGTYIAGRELPDWSAYFLFLFGIAVGVGGALATNSAPKAVEFARENTSVIVAVVCVVLAGRFF